MESTRWLKLGKSEGGGWGSSGEGATGFTVQGHPAAVWGKHGTVPGVGLGGDRGEEKWTSQRLDGETEGTRHGLGVGVPEREVPGGGPGFTVPVQKLLVFQLLLFLFVSVS